MNSLDSASAPPSDIIRSALFDEPDVDSLGFVLVKDITFACLNRDTLLPMYGRCHVAYVPKSGTIIGLSKLSRVVSSVCSRSLLGAGELCRSVIDMVREFSSGVAVVVYSNYGVFSRRDDGMAGYLFDELLVLLGIDEALGGDGDGSGEVGVRIENAENGVHGEDGEDWRQRHEAISRAVGALLEGIGEDAAEERNMRSARSYASWFLDATSGYYMSEVDMGGEVAGDRGDGEDGEDGGDGGDGGEVRSSSCWSSWWAGSTASRSPHVLG